MRQVHGGSERRDLRIVRCGGYIALRYDDGVVVSLPFLGVSSLNFGPLATAAFFLVLPCTGRPGLQASEPKGDPPAVSGSGSCRARLPMDVTEAST